MQTKKSFHHLIKWLFKVITVLFFTFIAIAFYTNVSTVVTKEDTEVFTDLGLIKPKHSLTFEQEIDLIRNVQREVFKRAPLGEGIPEYESREPKDLMRFGKGLCFDRSRTFDKAMDYLGLESRHVYLLYRENKSFIKAVFHYGQTSHAVTEVKTSRGWMFVDSNAEWFALDRNGKPVNADDVWKRFSDFENAPSYLKQPWWAIRGLYSRKGQLYGTALPFPDISWPNFLRWALGWD